MKWPHSLLLITLISCRIPDIDHGFSKLPNIGEKIEYHPENPFLPVYIGMNFTAEARDIRIQNINYRFGFWQGASTLVFIQSNDPNFVSPEGLSIGTPLEKVLQLGVSNPRLDPGCAYVTELPSGWYCAFPPAPEKASYTAPIDPSSKIIFFYRRISPSDLQHLADSTR